MLPALLLQDGGDLLQYFTARKILMVLAVLAVTALLIRYVSAALQTLSSRGPRARFVLRWLEPVVRIGLWFVAGFLVTDILAPSRDTFLAVIGSVAIAIGLGAQDFIKNVVGGLIILTDRPYQLGDRVKIGEAYGEIDHIGLRSTKLTTPDDTRVTIPNADILDSQVFNANSGVADCQVVTDVFLPASADPAEAQRIGYEAAFTSPYLYAAKPVVVLISEVLDERLYLRVRIKAYVYDHRFEPRMQSDITIRAKTHFRRAGMLGDY